MHDPGLGLLRLQAELGQQHPQPRQARPRPAAGLRTSPARRRRTGPAPRAPARPTPGRAGAGTRCTATGLITPPCGVPVTGRRTCPSSITPARSITRRSLSTDWSTDAFLDRLHQLVMRNRLKAVGDVRLHHPPAAPPGLIDEDLEGVVRRAFRAEPETARQQVRLEDRLEHDLHRGLHDPVTNRRNRQRPLLAGARLRDEHPTRRQRPIRCPPSVRAASSSSSRVTPYSSTSARVVPSMPGAPSLRRTVDPRTPQDVPAQDLVPQRVEPSPGIGLGRPVQRMLQGTNLVQRRDVPTSAGLATSALTGPLHLQHYASTKQRPFPHRRLCCPLGSTGTTAASDALPARLPLPGYHRL